LEAFLVVDAIAYIHFDSRLRETRLVISETGFDNSKLRLLRPPSCFSEGGQNLTKPQGFFLFNYPVYRLIDNFLIIASFKLLAYTP
jgi:hypothetical protein